jgi:hypothetical protein
MSSSQEEAAAHSAGIQKLGEWWQLLLSKFE